MKSMEHGWSFLKGVLYDPNLKNKTEVCLSYMHHRLSFRKVYLHGEDGKKNPNKTVGTYEYS